MSRPIRMSRRWRLPTALVFLALLSPLAAAQSLVPNLTPHLRLDGAALGMTPHQVRAATGTVDKSRMELRTVYGPDGAVRSHIGIIKEGFDGGGFFQAAFAPLDEAGNADAPRAHTITLNRRIPLDAKQQSGPAARSHLLDEVLAALVRDHGVYELLCVRTQDGGTEYRAWWAAAPDGCKPGSPQPGETHLYANLMAGSWLEIFLSLRAPR